MPVPNLPVQRATTRRVDPFGRPGRFTRLAFALVAAVAGAAMSVAADRTIDPGGAVLAAPIAQAGTCTITGRLRQSDASAHGGITVRTNDGVVATTADDGTFQLVGLNPGAVQLRATLRRHVSIAADRVPCVADAVTTMATVELPGGDADGNDHVDLFDLVRILAHYRQCAGQADFDAMADLDDSGCVDLYDLVRVASNYQVTGPLAWPVDHVTKPGPGAVSFRDDVLPIFARECHVCHGYVAGLNLDDHAHLMAGGNSGPVVVPGLPQASLLYLKVSRQVTPSMPPGGVRLSDEDVDVIRRWIEEGAADN